MRQWFLRSRVALALLMGATVPRAEAQQTPAAASRALSPYRAEQAETLLRTKLPCLGCHTLHGTGGRVGPDLSDVARRRTPAYIRGMVASPRMLVPGTIMPRVPMPETTFELIVQYLSEMTSTSHTPAQLVARPRPSAKASDTERLYVQHCAVCHGRGGRGDGANARYVGARVPAHTDARAMSARTDHRLYDGIYAGGYILGGSGRMPAFGQTLTHQQITSLVGYIRRLCRCTGPDWSRDGTARTAGQ